MLIKNKSNDNQTRYFNDEVNVHLNVIIDNYAYYASEKYGKLVKVDELTRSVKNMDINEQLMLRKKLTKNELCEESVLGIGLVLLVVGFLLLTGFALAEKSVREKMIDIFGIVVLASTIISVINIVCRFERRSGEIIKRIWELEKESIILDAKGNPVSEIWFLYHNLKFKDDEQKRLFLQNNYSKLNSKLCLNVRRYHGKDNIGENYLKNILESQNKSLNTTLHRVMMVQS